MGMAGGFIGLAILLGIGTMILGGATTDCSQLVGAPTPNSGGTNPGVDAKLLAANPESYKDGTATQANIAALPGGGGSSATTAGTYGLPGSWAHSCALAGAQAQSGYTLMLVALVITAAAVVLIVVRMLAA